jgi:hypothetical protein
MAIADELALIARHFISARKKARRGLPPGRKSSVSISSMPQRARSVKHERACEAFARIFVPGGLVPCSELLATAPVESAPKREDRAGSPG